MRHARFAAASMAGVAAVLSVRVAHGQVTATWLSPVSDNWTAAVRWSSDPFFPNNGNGGNNYHAVINATGSAYAVTLDQAITVDDFTLDSADATLDCSGGFAFIVNNDMLIGSGSIIDGLNLGGTFTVGGTVTFGNGAVRGVSSLRANGPIIYNPTTICEIDDSGVDHGDGSAVIQGSGDIVLSNGASIVNEASCTLTFASNSLVRLGSGAAPLFRNDGLMIRDTGAGVAEIQDVTFQNNGTLEVRTGTFRTNGVDVNGNGNRLSGGTWRLAGGDIDLVGQQVQINEATVEFAAGGGAFAALTQNLQTNDAAGTLIVGGGQSVSMTLPVQNNGMMEVQAASTLDLTAGLQNVAGSTMSGGQFLVQGTLRVPGATNVLTLASEVALDGAGAAIVQGATSNSALANLDTITTGGDLSLQNGNNFTTTGDFTVSGTGRLNIGAGTQFTANGTFTNFAGGTFSDGRIDVDGILQFNDADIGVIDAEMSLNGATAQIVDQFNQDAFRNLSSITTAGTLTVSDGRSLTLAGGLTQDGNLNIGRPGAATPSTVSMPGLLTQNGGALTLFNDGTAQSTAGFNQFAGLLAGNGTLDAVAMLGGDVGPGNSAGHLVINGMTTFQPTSTFLVELGGLLQGQPVGGYDWLEVRNVVVFAGGSAGTLSVSLIDGFVPNPGDVFEVLTYFAHNGTFAEHHGLEIGSGLVLVPEYLPDRLVLRTFLVPGPASAGVVALGLLAVLRRRR